MKGLTRLMIFLALISGLVLFPSCSNSDNAAQQEDSALCYFRSLIKQGVQKH